MLRVVDDVVMFRKTADESSAERQRLTRGMTRSVVVALMCVLATFVEPKLASFWSPTFPVASRERPPPRYLAATGLYENFWPATDISYIAPPFTIVNTAIPL